jgi:hypothetical protein
MLTITLGADGLSLGGRPNQVGGKEWKREGNWVSGKFGVIEVKLSYNDTRTHMEMLFSLRTADIGG